MSNNTEYICYLLFKIRDELKNIFIEKQMINILFLFHSNPEFLTFGEELMKLGKNEKIQNSRAQWLQAGKMRYFELEPFNPPPFLKTVNPKNPLNLTPRIYALEYINAHGWSAFFKTSVNLSNENIQQKFEDVKQLIDFLKTILIYDI